MPTDPKKNDEVKDEELERMAGGAGGDSVDERPDGGQPPPPIPLPPIDKYPRTEKT